MSLTPNGHAHPTTQKKEEVKKITGRLKALDVPGGLQEVASQKQEDGKKWNNGNEDPGDDDGSYCNDSNDLEEYLGQKEKCEHNINQRVTLAAVWATTGAVRPIS